MPLKLIVARCGRAPLLVGDVEALTEAERAVLLDTTPMGTSDLAALARAMPGGGWAIGRRSGGRCTWWLADPGYAAELDPPHALWTVPELFTAEGGGAPPAGLDVAELLPALEAFGGASRAAKLAAGVVRLLREGGPVAVVTGVNPNAREALALVVVAAIGRELTVAVGHPDPDLERHRLVIVERPVAGFTVLDAADPPDEGDDLVAWYVRDRLREDPQAILVPGGLTEDFVRDRLREGTLGATGSREAAVRGLVARLRAGADLDGALVDELVALTLATSDVRPWVEVQKRPSVVRQAAMAVLLERAEELRPNQALLEQLGRTYPRGAPLAPWCAALLGWLHRATRPGPFVELLEEGLLQWPQAAAGANRVSVWTEVVRTLVEKGWFKDAVAAVGGPVVNAMLEEGSGGAVATLWGTLPTDRRNPKRLGSLVERMARAPNGDRAAAQVLLHVRESAAEVDVLLKTWIRTRGAAAIDEDDALFRAVMKTEHASDWLSAALAAHAPAAVVRLLDVVITGSEDPLWLAAEAALGAGLGARDRFVSLRLLGGGRVALEPLARGLVEAAVLGARFPDPALAETARQFVEVPGSSSIWGWVAVAASAPGRWPDDVVDGTVVALCASPPTNAVERQVCLACAEALGAAAEWEPLDHARWVVRFALAPDGDHTGFPEGLVTAMIAGLIGRFDAGPHLARLVLEMLELPSDHPALVGLLTTWLPDAWTGRVPASFIEAVEARGVPAPLRAAWVRLVG
jgi:hypothetical protein